MNPVVLNIKTITSFRNLCFLKRWFCDLNKYLLNKQKMLKIKWLGVYNVCLVITTFEYTNKRVKTINCIKNKC